MHHDTPDKNTSSQGKQQHTQVHKHCQHNYCASSKAPVTDWPQLLRDGTRWDRRQSWQSWHKGRVGSCCPSEDHGAKAKTTTALTEIPELPSHRGMRRFCNVLYVSTHAYQDKSAQVYRTLELQGEKMMLKLSSSTFLSELFNNPSLTIHLLNSPSSPT